MSYSGASTLTVVKVPASTEAAAAKNDDRPAGPARTAAARAFDLMSLILSGGQCPLSRVKARRARRRRERRVKGVRGEGREALGGSDGDVIHTKTKIPRRLLRNFHAIFCHWYAGTSRGVFDSSCSLQGLGSGLQASLKGQDVCSCLLEGHVPTLHPRPPHPQHQVSMNIQTYTESRALAPPSRVSARPPIGKLCFFITRLCAGRYLCGFGNPGDQ